MKIIAPLGILAAAAIACAGAAQADTHIYVGGDGDCTGDGFMNEAQAKDVDWDPNANNIAVGYGSCQGDFAPFPGNGSRTDTAVAEGVTNVTQAWQDNCANTSDPCILYGASMGTAIVSIVGTNVGADQAGSNTHVVTLANPWGAPGIIGSNPGMVGDFLGWLYNTVTGTPINVPQVAGSENRFNVNDFLADGAQQSMSGLWEMYQNLGQPNGHQVPEGLPTDTYTTSDGVVQEVYGDPPAGVVAPQDNPAVK